MPTTSTNRVSSSSLPLIQCIPSTVEGFLDTGDAKDIPLTFYKPITADPSTHTMGPALLLYVIPKVHTILHTNDFTSILVIGNHTRSPPALTAASEKTNKPFNWQRPTATILDTLEGKVLQLNVFPGRAYVEHYGALLATYLASQAFTNTHVPPVRYLLPPPDICASIFANSNLPRLGLVDVVVLGYVDMLACCTSASNWETGVQQGNALFGWKKRMLNDGRRVAFVGCTMSYWGDIAGQLVRTLHSQNCAQVVIYVGKMGTLDARHVPNAVLGTGSSSRFVDGGMVEWENVLGKALEGAKGVVSGAHYTVSTSLCETNEWVRERRGKSDWVDPEIGHMAMACVERGVGFGYLHVVSDNLSREDSERLVNERKGTILADRMKLFQEVDRVLEKYFSESQGV